MFFLRQIVFVHYFAFGRFLFWDAVVTRGCFLGDSIGRCQAILDPSKTDVGDHNNHTKPCEICKSLMRTWYLGQTFPVMVKPSHRKNAARLSGKTGECCTQGISGWSLHIMATD